MFYFKINLPGAAFNKACTTECFLRFLREAFERIIIIDNGANTSPYGGWGPRNLPHVSSHAIAPAGLNFPCSMCTVH